MTHKLVIETERHMRDVYTAEFNQPLLEHLAVNFMAEQQGIDLNTQGVRVQFEMNVSPEARPGRRVNLRARIFVEAPIEDKAEGDERPSGAETALNAIDSHLCL